MRRRTYFAILLFIITVSYMSACSMNGKLDSRSFHNDFTQQRNHVQSGRVLEHKGEVYFSVLNEIAHDHQKTATYKGSIFLSDLEGNQLVKIADHYASFLTIHNDWLYFSTDNLYRMPKEGGEIEHLISGRDLEFTIQKDKIYFVDKTLEDGIYESSLDGSYKKKIYEGGASDLVVQDEFLYFVRKADYRLHAISLKDYESSSVIKDSVGQFCIDEQHVIYTGENLYIYTLSEDSSKIMVDESVSTFNLQGEWIYYISAEGGDPLKPLLFKAHRDGSEKVALLDHDISYYDMEIYIIGKWIYLFNPYNADRLIRMNLDGGDLQVLRFGEDYKCGIFDKFKE